MRSGWVRAGVAIGLVACGSVAWFAVHYVVQARDPSTAGTVAQALAAVFVPLAALAAWLVTKFQRCLESGSLRRRWRCAHLAM